MQTYHMQTALWVPQCKHSSCLAKQGRVPSARRSNAMPKLRPFSMKDNLGPEQAFNTIWCLVSISPFLPKPFSLFIVLHNLAYLHSGVHSTGIAFPMSEDLCSFWYECYLSDYIYIDSKCAMGKLQSLFPCWHCHSARVSWAPRGNT